MRPFDVASSLLPLDSSPAISNALPVPLGTFFSSFFNRQMLRLNHTDTGLDVDLHVWTRADLAAQLDAIAADGKMVKGTNAMSIHPAKGPAANASDSELPSQPMSAEASGRFVENGLAKGVSFVLKFEYVSERRRPMRWLSEGLFQLTGIPASVHLYCSAAGAQVLKPHTDPYDVLVWQLRGVKRWRACVPRKEIAAAAHDAFGAEGLTDAQRCLLQELARDNIEGCTTYSVDDTHSLE